ncbi:CLUMA_CG005981, isoform A [Clunio marinus]|uniref:CLUMA_CG005981, isoform A n=1 Tax=Clunio marinus TaxID=568069 RepID=A0A1J1HWH1_9DIPT|nr:CLUMA_CG005981, isoform A [Clunio marinus]
MKGVYFVILFYLFKVAISDEDLKVACITQYLKEQGRLDEDFPESNKNECALVLPIVFPILKDRFATKMSEIKSECVSTQLKTDGLVDYLMKEEIIKNLTEFSAQEVTKKLDDTRQIIRNILENAAEVCGSEITYEDIHDKYLLIMNETKAIAMYCMLTLVIDTGIIDVGNLEINPSNIDTTKIECESVLNAARINVARVVKKEFKNQNMPQCTMNCAMRVYRRNKMFENSIAMAFSEKLDISPEINERNKENIQARIEFFSKGIIRCFLKN